MNTILIGMSLGCFLYELSLGPALPAFLATHGWVPEQFSLALTRGEVPTLRPFVMSLFLHGDWVHLFGNIIGLLVLGGEVEKRLGPVRYLCLYIGGGLLALLIQTALAPFSSLSMIGASGAVASVAGAYCVFFSSLQDLTFMPRMVSQRIKNVPTVMFLAVWFVFHLVMGVYAHAVATTPSSVFAHIAWGAHVGGFLGGIFLCPVLLAVGKPRRVSGSAASSVLFE